MDGFIIMSAGIFAFFVLAAFLYGGKKTAGYAIIAIAGFGLVVFSAAWYSGMRMFSSELATSNSAKASLLLNNMNGELAMSVCGILLVAGFLLYFSDRIFKKHMEVPA